MTLSIRERILAELAVRVEALAAAEGMSFERNRLGDIEDGELLAGGAIVQHDGGMRRLDGDTGGQSRELSVSFEGYCRAAAGAALGAEVSRLAAAIETAARPDAAGLRLGGIADDVRVEEMTDPEFGRDPSAGHYAVFELRLAVAFTTAEFDPTTTA